VALSESTERQKVH